jgi:tetratricopeptide (TPR) repeat protein
MTLLEIISGIGGKKAVAFLEKHFDACMALDREQTLSACEDLACRFCLDRIRPKINKGQADIDNAYMMISLLDGNRTPDVETQLTAYYQRSQDQARRMDTFASGDILGTFKPYVEVELKCGQCGDVNTYRVNRIIADKTQENYIAQEIECINCGQIPEFDITRSGNMKISIEMMRMTFLNSEKDIAKAMDVSPIEMTRFSAFGKEMGVRLAIETYKQRIEEEPDNAEYHIGLGNTYFYLDKLTAAAPYFEKSITLNPDYIEAYYALAEIAEAKNDPDKALAWLKKGVPLLKAMKFMKYSMIDPIEFEDEYIGFYNELLVRTGGPQSDYMKTLDLPPGYYAPPPKPFVRENQKIGRNDSCPCGSGKKYKKCCLNKS